MEKQTHILELEVRDYECDYQGVVNNSVYQNYLEHARHSAIRQHFSVPKLSQQGLDLVVVEIQLSYLQPLRPQDRFAIHSTFGLHGHFRLIFEQYIVKLGQQNSGSLELTGPENLVGQAISKSSQILKAKVCVAALENGRPCPFSRVTELCGYNFG